MDINSHSDHNSNDSMNTHLQYLKADRKLGLPLSCIFFCLICFFSASIYAENYAAGKQAYQRKDYDRALAILKPLAEAGDSQAQITLGFMYDHGQGVEKSPTESIKWYRMAAEQGVPFVQHDMGVKYFQGQGVEQNYLEAAKWWELSGNAGIADSQFNLGLMYYRGLGVPKNYVKAATLFEAAAVQGHGSAQYSLAVMYAFGQSKNKDYATALKWFRKSAAQNIAQAQFNLGVFNENGYGVDKDLEKARTWYQLAADQGLPEAVQKLQTLAYSQTETVAKINNQTSSTTVDPTENTESVSTANPPTTSVSRLNLTGWLQQQATDKYTLQLASVTDENSIIQYIKRSGLTSEVGYVVVIVNGMTRYNAVYGIYDAHAEAKRAINELPAAVQKANPWVRNIGILQGLLQ